MSHPDLTETTGVLTITFSEAIDVTPATNVVPAKIHLRESGSYTGGITLSAGELDTTADGTTISFTLTASNRAAAAGLAVPETDNRARGGTRHVRQSYCRLV